MKEGAVTAQPQPRTQKVQSWRTHRIAWQDLTENRRLKADWDKAEAEIACMHAQIEQEKREQAEHEAEAP